LNKEIGEPKYERKRTTYLKEEENVANQELGSKKSQACPWQFADYGSGDYGKHFRFGG
jgi:hypothetical protein